MQMSDQQPRNTFAGLLLALVLNAAPALIAAAQTGPAETDKAAEPPASETNAGQQGQARQKPPPGAESPSPEAKPLKEFKPTETIRADSAVAFPIDI
jgi:hypothetical protein